MGIHAPHHRPFHLDAALLLLPVAGALGGLVLGSRVNEPAVGTVVGISLGLIAATTLTTLRGLPYEQRRLAAELVLIPLALGTAIVTLLAIR